MDSVSLGISITNLIGSVTVKFQIVVKVELFRINFSNPIRICDLSKFNWKLYMKFGVI